MKKKVLILAYDFPPYLSIGALRPYSWCKYLDKNEWDITVVTRQWDTPIQNPVDYVKPTTNQQVTKEQSHLGTLIRVPFKPNLRDRIILKRGLDSKVIQRKALTVLYNFGKHTTPLLDNTFGIFVAAQQELKENNYDLILATGEPFILFRYAHLLSTKHNVPWIADYRDGWTTNQQLSDLSAQDRILTHFYKLKEKKYIQSSQLITTASPSYKKALQLLFPTKKIEVVYNGFFSEDVPVEAKIKANHTFQIAYVGTLYPHQKLEVFLAGLRLFIAKHQLQPEQLEVIFYGMEFYPEQKERVQAFDQNLNTFFVFTERIAYQELLKQLQRADLLLLLSQKGIDWLNAKIFDYMAVNKRIFFAENDHGIMEQILKEIGNSVYLCDTREDVSENLIKAFEEYNIKGELVNTNLEQHQYTRSYQTAELGRLMKSVSL